MEVKTQKMYFHFKIIFKIFLAYFCDHATWHNHNHVVFRNGPCLFDLSLTIYFGALLMFMKCYIKQCLD